MNGQGTKLLDFTGIMEYRTGEYYPVSSTHLINKMEKSSRLRNGMKCENSVGNW